MLSTQHTVTLDRPTRCVLVLLNVLLVILVVELWVLRPNDAAVANAQIPDAGQQSQKVISEIRTSNLLLARIASDLETRTIKVQSQGVDKAQGSSDPDRR